MSATATATATVNRTELGRALAFASLGLAKHPVTPALTAMRVTAAAGTLEFATFDYETHASVAVAGEGSGTSEALVSGKELAAAFSSLPAVPAKDTADVAVTVTAEGMTLLCDGWNVNVEAMPAEAAAEYPAFPPLPALTGTVAGDVLARSAARTAACAGKDDTLPVLTHVSVTSSEGNLVLAATDRYRLAVDRQPFAAAADGTALVPAVLLAKFAKACDKAGKVSVFLDGERAAFSDGTRTVVTRAGAGEFIRYERILGAGETYPTVVTVGAAALAAVVTRAGKVTGENERMGFRVTGTGITLTAVRGGKTSGTQVVPATVTGPDTETGFNAGYLASVLTGITGDARIELRADPQEGEKPKPARVTSDDGFTAIVVPIRLPESPFSKAA